MRRNNIRAVWDKGQCAVNGWLAIPAAFSAEVMAGRDFSLLIFSGESREPEKVQTEIIAEFAAQEKSGLDAEMFARCKKAAYGHYVGSFGSVESVASLLLHGHFAGLCAFDVLDFIADITIEQVGSRLALIDPARCAISIVHP